MTDLEKLQQAKLFVDKMANGINPMNDTEIPREDVLNDVCVSRCLFFVSDILRQVMEAENKGRKRNGKIPFSITAEQIARYPMGDEAVSLSDFAKKLFEIVGNQNMKRLTYRQISDWLVKVGMLAERETANNRRKKYPTEEGIKMGITEETRMGQYGIYTVILYQSTAQQFLLDNLEAILSGEE